MSNVSNVQNASSEQNPASKQEEDKFVAKSAYEEVSKDMHRYKSAAKEAAAKAAELEARMKSIEEAKLVEEKRYEELYSKERDAREKAEQALKNTNEHYMKSVKMTALVRELGGNIKTKYLQHAALDEIIVHDDGSLSSESVTKVANKFRQENPELVPAQNAGNINDVAPGNTPLTTKEKRIEDMSQDEKRALLASKRTQSSRVGIRA